MQREEIFKASTYCCVYSCAMSGMAELRPPSKDIILDILCRFAAAAAPTASAAAVRMPLPASELRAARRSIPCLISIGPHISRQPSRCAASRACIITTHRVCFAFVFRSVFQPRRSLAFFLFCSSPSSPRPVCLAAHRTRSCAVYVRISDAGSFAVTGRTEIASASCARQLRRRRRRRKTRLRTRTTHTPTPSPVFDPVIFATASFVTAYLVAVSPLYWLCEQNL